MFVFPSISPFPKRYVTIALVSLGMLIVHAQRVNISVTVVFILTQNMDMLVNPGKSRNTLPSMQWNSGMIGLLHSMFFIGNLATLLPAGYLSIKLPSHRVFGISIMCSCGFNIIMPISMERFGFAPTCVIRLLQGMSEGFLFPSCYAILSHWSTPKELSRMGATVLGGVYLGAVVGLPLSGFITNYTRWDLVYYVCGGAGLIWSVVWMVSIYEKPSMHPTISKEERAYISDQQKHTIVLDEEAESIPWGSILTSPPVYAIIMSDFARSFIFYLLITNEPEYINVFGFSIAMNGLLSALPHLGKALAALSSGPMADYMLANGTLSVTHIRKLFTCVGFGGECLGLLLLGFLETRVLCVVILIIANTFVGFTASGWNINHLDLAPRYASVLVSLSTASGTLAGVIVPLVTGRLTRHQVLWEWQNVFLLSSGILAFAVIIYIVFGTAKRQKWADPPLPEVMLLLPGHRPDKKTTYQTIKPNEPKRSPVTYPPDADNPAASGPQTPTEEGATPLSIFKEFPSKEEEEESYHIEENEGSRKEREVLGKDMGKDGDLEVGDMAVLKCDYPVRWRKK